MHTKTAILFLILTVWLGTVTCQGQAGSNGMTTNLQSLLVARCTGNCKVIDGVKNCKDRFGKHAVWTVVQNKTMDDFIANVLEREVDVTRLVVNGRNSGKGFVDGAGKLLPYMNWREDKCIEIGAGTKGWKAIGCSEQSDDIGHVCQVYYKTKNQIVMGNHLFEVFPCSDSSPARCNWDGASAMCTDGKGKIAVVPNDEINGQLVRIAKTLAKTLPASQTPQGTPLYLLIDAKYGNTTDVWMSEDGNVLPYTNFQTCL